jgi:phosphoenolpyruvate-protein phosphotransferase (PTS system enzyme I)
VGEKVLRGIAASPGVARGRVLILGKPTEDSVLKQHVSPEELPAQVKRFQDAMSATREQILGVQRQVGQHLGSEEAGIFDAHLLVLDDPVLIEEVHRTIHEQNVTAEYAFRRVTEKYVKALDAIPDEFLRERAADMRDVAQRVLHNLQGRSHDPTLHDLEQPCVIVSHDLTPSQTAVLDRKKVLGFATDIGSKTSHAAILARSMRIPAVVGLRTASQTLQEGDDLLVDGVNGLLILNPTDQTLFQYGQLVRKKATFEEHLHEVRDLPAVTLDGHRMTLSANVEQASDTDAVTASGAEGIGLFRTEFLFISRDRLPTEEEQYEAYRQVAATLKPAPVVIRTLDLGGDKFVSTVQVPQEVNPFLGWRAIRFCLQQRDLFSEQIRAILRASVEGNVKMMYPMISGLEELIQANALVEECKAELRSRNVPFDEAMEVGAMIEIPSAALVTDALARRVKFFSLGTNDLIQYTLAVDRLNEKIAHLYEPTHPAILRLIRLTVEAGHRHGIWVGVCGEMAGDPVMVPLLLGLGVNELSVAPPSVASIKHLIRRLKLSEAKELAEFALTCESGAEILARSRALVRERAPGLVEDEN